MIRPGFVDSSSLAYSLFKQVARCQREKQRSRPLSGMGTWVNGITYRKTDSAHQCKSDSATNAVSVSGRSAATCSETSDIKNKKRADARNVHFLRNYVQGSSDVSNI